MSTKETNGLAIASLVLGILWLWWLGSLLALIFGYVARRQIRASSDRQGGEGLALAGIVLGWIGAAVLVVGGIAVLVIANSGGNNVASNTSATTPFVGPSPNDGLTPSTTFAQSGSNSSGSSGNTSLPSGPSPSVDGMPAGKWVTFLGSFANPANAQNARQQFASGSVPDAAILHSDDYTSLLPGYWVVYADHGFQSGADTLTFCHSLGFHTDHDCHGRYLSTAPGLDGHNPRFSASNGQ